ncbi:hypothetical protein KKI19_04165 [Patescibacteria group bacterium]|nr:hypothetical protein [Patescibacteria group bacterium]
MIDLSKQYSFGQIKSLAQGFGYLIGLGFAIAAIAVIFYFTVGSFKFLTSGGDKNAVASARDMLVHAIIGFILLMVMFLILQFLPEFLGFKIKLF